MNKMRLSPRKIRFVSVAVVLTAVIVFSATAGVMETDFPIPHDDPKWQRVAEMWEVHWNGKNIDAMLDLCHELEAAWPGRIEPLLWLGRLYYLKGAFEIKKREKYHRKAETYAKKVHAIDKANFLALFILVHAVISRTDHDAVMEEYGGWIREMSPLPVEKELPDMPYSDEWRKAMLLWKDRETLSKLEEAVDLISEFAEKTPKDALAQLWAGFGFHILGAHYSYRDQHVEKGVPSFRRSIGYLKKSLAIDPYSVPAHYFLQFSLARSVEQSTILAQAFYLKPIMENLLFCIRENALYDSCGPVYIAATMILEGGFVCKKGMEMAGYTVEMVMLGLEIGEILYPDQYYIPYIHAVLLDKHYKKPDQAILLLKRILKRGMPKAGDPQHIDKKINYSRAKQFRDTLVARLSEKKDDR